MGFFNKFKKNTDQPKQSMPSTYSQGYNIDLAITTTQDGFLQIDLYDVKDNLNNFYDTTRLIINSASQNIAGNVLQDCLVSYYGHDDTTYADPNIQRQTRMNQYTHVLAEFDVDRLLNRDIDYARNVLIGLLNENRIQRYMQNGLSDSPQQPCGNYVGGITPEGKKYFRPQVGQIVHNSPKMQQKRQLKKEEKARANDRKREENRRKIAELEAENDRLENDR
jgi:hypothetical protein